VAGATRVDNNTHSHAASHSSTMLRAATASRALPLAAKRFGLAPRPQARAMSLLAPDQTTPEFYAYHKTHLAMLALLPAAFVIPHSALTTPVDLLLAVAIPVHAHIGMNWIITDYVPPAGQSGTRAAMLAVSVLAMAGLVKLSLDGDSPGLIGSLKALWAADKKKAKADDKKKH
jgi:succinate dehydrogenase (ubiquinone) membrane anchor subunit